MTRHATGAGLCATLRMLLYENDEGGYCIEYDRLSSLFARFGESNVDQVVLSLDQKLEALAAALGRAPTRPAWQGRRSPWTMASISVRSMFGERLTMAGTDPTKGNHLLYLDDLHVGQRFVSGTHQIDEQQIKAFAGQFDPQPFHLDAEAAKHSLFGGLVASGWHTAAITMRLMVEGGLPIAGGLVGAGGECAWPHPTRPGALLHVESEIIEVRPSRSRPERGMATVRSETRNQSGEIVQVLVAKLVVLCKISVPPPT